MQWVCEVLLLEYYLQNYVVLVDFHRLGLSAQFKHSLYGLGFKALFRIKHSFTTVIPLGMLFFHISGFSIFLLLDVAFDGK